MCNDRDFIFDNFEEEEKDMLNNENNSVVEPIFPSINLNELTDEQTDKLFNVLGNGINKILHDLCSIDDDDDIPFW